MVPSTENSVVIVTGASRGIGKAVAHWLAGKGVDLVLVARTQSELDNVTRQLADKGVIAVGMSGDVSDPQFCQHVVSATYERFAKIDGLINNAAVVQPLARLSEAQPESWSQNISINLLGPFYMTRYAIGPLRQSSGKIVNVSSGAATTAIVAASAYCVAKAGLNQFTKLLAVEEPTITSVAVRPGVVDTQMQAVLRSDGQSVMPENQHDYYYQLKEKNLLEPPEIPARSIAWLALYAPKSFSGRFMSYDDPEIMTPAISVFGEPGA